MTRTGFWSIGTLATATLAACVTNPSVDRAPSLFANDGVSFWTLTSLNSEPSDATAILHFEGRSLSLDVPCYRRSWAQSYHAGAMTFPNPWASEPRCGDTIPHVIVAFDSVISTVRNAELAGDDLVLLNAQGQTVLTAKRLRSTGLEYGTWAVEWYFDGESLVSAREKFAPPLRPHMTFLRGRLYGTAGCGSLEPVSRYQIDRERVRMEIAELLTGSCVSNVRLSSEPGMAADVEKALSGERLMTRDRDRFLLRDTSGRTMAILMPAQ